MNQRLIHLPLLLLLCTPLTWGQAPRRDPYCGYVFPAGGRQGSVISVIVGGQNLRGTLGLYLSGEGVRARIIEHARPLTPQQRGDAGQHLGMWLQQRRAEAQKTGLTPAIKQRLDDIRAKLMPLPDHPWLRGLDKMTIPQLEALRWKLFNPKLQPNAQIAEQVQVEITIAPDAAPGDRELRLQSAGGLTNPLHFVVSEHPEYVEEEPNATGTGGHPALPVPVTLNGQILPGDVDRFRITAHQGQRLVIAAHARRFTPYLADAVPGWFQATLAIYTLEGQELAFADDYRFDPDPVLFFTPPQDGDYVVELRDSIYRGREDFVYRLSVSEHPFITSLFPLGGRINVPTAAKLTGVNLPVTDVTLNTTAGTDGVRETAWRGKSGVTNRVSYAVDSLPESLETEPNDTHQTAQPLTLPLIINGRITKAGDVDYLRFDGQANEQIVAEVHARRLGTPLDSLLRLTDATGKVLAWNDDQEDKAAGLLTHHADSYLLAKLPADGTYYVQLSDAQRHGGEEYAYRLRLSAPRPDFALRLVPSAINVPAGRTATVTAVVIRKDGFDGEIDLTLPDAPAGFKLSGARIERGKEQVRCTLTAPPLAAPTAPLQMVGGAQIDGHPVTRPVVAAEDLMQAFAYQHLVPAQALLVTVTGPRRFQPEFTVVGTDAVRLTPGGTAEVKVTVNQKVKLEPAFLWELNTPPPGITLEKATPGPDGLTLLLKAADTVKIGTADTLLITISADVTRKRPDGQSVTVRSPLGVLPAIRYEIVQP
jgi:hypothetical protein